MMDIAERAGLIFLWGGSIVGMGLGLALLISPDKTKEVNNSLSRWVDTERVEDVMDKPRLSERLLYRNHRLVGAFLLFGALYILNIFLFGNGLHALSSRVSIDLQILISVAANIFIVGSVIAAVIGLIMLTRPSLLKEIEQSANRWIATEAIRRFFNQMHSSSDQFLLAHRKKTGAFLLLGGIYIFVILGYFAMLRG